MKRRIIASRVDSLLDMDPKMILSLRHEAENMLLDAFSSVPDEIGVDSDTWYAYIDELAGILAEREQLLARDATAYNGKKPEAAEVVEEIVESSIREKKSKVVADAELDIPDYDEVPEGWYPYEEAIEYIEERGCSCDPGDYEGEIACDLLDERLDGRWYGDEPLYKKSTLDEIIKIATQRSAEFYSDDDDVISI